MNLLCHALAMMLVVPLLVGCDGARGSAPGTYYHVQVDEAVVAALRQAQAPVPAEGAGQATDQGGGPGVDLTLRGSGTIGGHGGGAHGGGCHGGGSFGSSNDLKVVLVVAVAVVAVFIVYEIGKGIYESATATPRPVVAYDLVLSSPALPTEVLRVRDARTVWLSDDLIAAVQRGAYDRVVLQPAGDSRIGALVRIGIDGVDLAIRPAPALAP